jgi:hypothetical protein
MKSEPVWEQTNETRSWVDSLGFQFDPFKYLNASDDPHLGEYIVNLEQFYGAWENQPALIFAPAGGGKTTLRIYTYRAAWVGRDGMHPFPVQYYLPLINDGADWTSSLEEDLKRAVGDALFLTLSFRPERLKRVSERTLAKVSAFLSESIGRDYLTFYLSVLAQKSDPMLVAELIDRTYKLPDPPSPDSVKNLVTRLANSLPRKDARKATTLEQITDRLSELIIGDLQFESIFLLIDGVDGFADSVNELRKASEQINRLLSRTKDWARKGIYIKLFLPEETDPLIRSKLWRTYIRWEPDSLANVIKQRIQVASGGQFGSLNGVSGPGLRNDFIERILAENVVPLPREIIFATQQLFTAYFKRSHGLGKIEPEDLETALGNYREDVARRHIRLPHRMVPG